MSRENTWKQTAMQDLCRGCRNVEGSGSRLWKGCAKRPGSLEKEDTRVWKAQGGDL